MKTVIVGILNGLRKVPPYSFHLAGCQVPLNGGGGFEGRDPRRAGGRKQGRHTGAAAFMGPCDLFNGRRRRAVEV